MRLIHLFLLFSYLPPCSSYMIWVTAANMGGGGVQGSSVMKPQVRLCERGSATPDFRLNVKPAVSEQRPRCHNVTLKEQFSRRKSSPLVPRSPLQGKKKNESRRQKETLT